MRKTHFDTRRLVGTAALSAIVVVLSFIPIKVGTFTINLTLIPIVVGAILFGPIYGAFIGFVGGIIAIIDSGFFWSLITDTPTWQQILSGFGIILICFGKTSLAGFVSGIIYKSLYKKNKWIAVILASISAPIINTGTFILLSWAFLYQPIMTFAASQGATTNVFAFIILAFVGLNFFVELGVNSVLSPVVYKLADILDAKLIKDKPQPLEETASTESQDVTKEN